MPAQKKLQRRKLSINKDVTEFGLVEWDIPSDIIKVCPYLSQTLAFPTQETTQTYSAYRQLTHPDDTPPINDLIKKIKEKKSQNIVVESRKLCRDGTWRWFSLRAKVIESDKDGNPLRAFGTCTDITDFKEEAKNIRNMKLLFSEINHIKECYKKDFALDELCAEILESFKNLTESSNPLLMFSSKSDMKSNVNEFTNSNDPALYNLDENEGRNLMANPQKLKFVNKMLNSKTHCFQNGETTSLLGIHFDLPLQQQGLVIIERDEAFDDSLLELLEPLIGTATHIISIKKLQANSSELDSILSFFIQQVPAPVAMFDTNMCYKFASDAWRKEFKEAETSYNIVGKSHYEIHPGQPKEWRTHHERALSGEVLTFEATEIVGYLTETFWAEGAIYPWYNLNGSIGGIIIYSNVVTDRKKNEQSLKDLVDNLSRSNQALDRFAHVCSHDLKEPLRGIANFIHLLFQHNSKQFDEESLLFVGHIQKGVERMNALIQDILLYSEAAAQTKCEKVSIDMNAVVCDIKEAFDFRLSEIGAQLKADTLPTITAVKSQTNQLLTNLISNAIKFRSDKPLVIDIFSIERGDFWEFHVRDNGIGIEEEYHTSIFTMFKRLHSKSTYEGSGIGLATCKKIVNDHQGEIYIQSVLEGGSEFIFTLPK